MLRSIAQAARLWEITRDHWSIESGLRYRRDVTLREDRSRVRTSHGPQALKAINNLVLGYISASEARRHRRSLG